MKLSNKKRNELYNVIHEDIMQLRIKIAMPPETEISRKEVDELLSKLCISAPQKAIDLFTDKQSK